MTQLPVHRYQFNCLVKAPLTFNFYAGSLLRGAFGQALRKLVCVTRMSDCKACLLYRQCVYPKIFETPVPLHSPFQSFSQIPNPFIVEPPPMGITALMPGDTFSFNVVLIGQALAQLPLIIYAWQTALNAGLGPTHANVELIDVVFEPDQPVAQVIYRNDAEARLLPAPEFIPEPLAPVDRLTLQLLTPLRIQQKGQVLSSTLRGKDFLIALVRRYYFLQEFHTPDYQAPDFKDLARQAENIEARHSFSWCEWQRYSSRQQQKMIFGGVMGELELNGDLSAFLPLLLHGQWWHVGNKTTFGMGHYQLMP
jgi:CRISPR/Cas system endoribonuclease Cas6 (RAMP superfamily)